MKKNNNRKKIRKSYKSGDQIFKNKGWGSARESAGGAVGAVDVGGVTALVVEVVILANRAGPAIPVEGPASGVKIVDAEGSGCLDNRKLWVGDWSHEQLRVRRARRSKESGLDG